jgi:MYXO-CTERM domain-containing protein
MGRPSTVAAAIAVILIALLPAGAASAQSTDPSISDYQEGVPGADGSLDGGSGGGLNQGSDGSGPGAASEGTGGGSGGGGGGATGEGSRAGGGSATPGASQVGAGGDSTGRSGANGAPGQVAQSNSNAGSASGGPANLTVDGPAGDSPSGLGDVVEGVTSAFGSDSEGSGLGIVFPALLAALLGAFAFVVIRRRREPH